MDCFAVSIASSIAYGKYNWPKILRMALFFGAFQGLMPLIGWALGVGFADAIRSIDHWLALAILGYLGGKMMWEGLHEDKAAIDDADGIDDYSANANPAVDDATNKNDNVTHEVDEKKSPYGSVLSLVVLSVATSIDALATGLIFVPFGNLIFTAMAVIFAGSFIFTLTGCIAGVKFGSRFKVNVEAIGGAILILIGVNIFIEHMIF